MQVEVNPAGWEAQRHEIHALLTNVVQHFLAHCPERRGGRIHVYFRRGERHPLIGKRHSPADPFPIGLTVVDRLWDQFVYQFAHEFCHILCDYEKERCNQNHWTQEMLCEVAALFALRQMAISWRNAPPFPNWRDYAGRFDQYANGFVADHQLPNDVALRDWVLENEEALRANCYDRLSTAVIAVHLLPLFQLFPQGWRSVWYLPASSATFDNFIAEWHRSCPDEHRGFILQMAVRFGIKIGTKFSNLMLLDTTPPVEKN